MALRIDNLPLHSIVEFNLYEGTSVFLGVHGEGNDRVARFESKHINNDKTYIWEAYRYKGYWAVGSSAQRLSLLSVTPDPVVQATTEQGLDPIVAALTEAGFAPSVEQTGGLCIVVTVRRGGAVFGIIASEGSEDRPWFLVYYPTVEDWDSGDGYPIIHDDDELGADEYLTTAEVIGTIHDAQG